MNKWYVLFSILVAAALVGCGATPKPQAGNETPVVVVKSDADTIIAEGVVTPARSSYLYFKLPGEVVEILAQVGDTVDAGAPLMRLDTAELLLSLRNAELSVAAQQAALEQLKKGASDRVIARADKANADQIAQAQVALRAKQLQFEQAQAEDPAIGVRAAQAGVDQLQYRLAQTRAQDPAPAVVIAQVGLERARIALNDTQNEYNKALDRPWEDQQIRDGWAKRLEQAQLDYRLAQAQLDNARNSQTAFQLGLSVMAAQVQEAETRLAQARVAQQTYSTTLALLQAEVDAARLQLESLQSWDNPYRDEASPEEIARIEALLAQAQVAVETIRLKLDDATLLAPFAGTVVDVQAEIGDQVNVGQVVVILATLDALEIHTKDLTELDVARVAVGQSAILTVDALPGREFRAAVTEIGLQGKDYRGDVVYEVVLIPDQPIAALRWGMTALVKIKTK